jgi:hypothetical protein
MKRIVSIAALAVALASIPATAMASTGSPARGPGPVPAAGPARCPVGVIKPPPGGVVVPVVKPAPGKPVVVVVACCGQVLRSSHRPVRATRVCQSQTVVFDMAAGSSVVTEVHGARLHHGERLLYKGQLYTVRSVWGDHFDVDQRGSLVVNTGQSIWKGVAIEIPPGVVLLSPAPGPIPPGR